MAAFRFGINDKYILIYAMLHRIAIIVFPKFQLLDAIGPTSIFGAASEAVKNGYSLALISDSGGPVSGLSGISVETQAAKDMPPSQFDSFFIVGGNSTALEQAAQSVGLRDWVRDAASHHRRYGSICSGSVLLAAWGIIGARRFATHWRAVDEVRKRWPALNLDPEAIFVEDGALWTSAGVTTGIDMALAIVEHDHGPELAQSIAQRLVLSARRPGWQSQFSPSLNAGAPAPARYAALIERLKSNLAEAISVEAMADQCNESLRSFHRNFTSALGQTPAQYLIRLRVDRARSLIADGLPLKQVAQATGFGDAARLSSAFRKTQGLSAHEWRVLHCA
jgi:transcriptional regulator GlxA family with amidase domain